MEMESLQMPFKIAVRNFYAFNASWCMVPSHGSGYYRLVVVKMIRAAASAWLPRAISL